MVLKKIEIKEFAIRIVFLGFHQKEYKTVSKVHKWFYCHSSRTQLCLGLS